MKNIILQAILLVAPPFFVGFITVPLTNELANNNSLLQNCYLGGLRFIYTIFVLAFSQKIILIIKKLFTK